MSLPSTAPTPVQPLSVVCSDLSGNCLGRALVLAELAALDAPTRVIGIQSTDAIWAPAQSSKIPIVGRRLTSAWGYRASARWLKEQLRGTRVIVSKPLVSSLGLTRRAGVEPEQLLLDNDDWEPGLRHARAARRGLRFRCSQFLQPSVLNSYYSTLALDRGLKRYPHMTVSNAFLQGKYGGRILPHVRDTDFLDPARVDPQAIRSELEMQGRRWVGFIGTIRQHKGVGELIQVLSEMKGSTAPGIYVAGADLEDDYTRQLYELANSQLGSERVRFRPPFSFETLPAQVAPVDVICLPGLDDPGAHGQLPAKLMDAMCMGKAVVASGHNDIIALLDGCGISVTPGRPGELGSALSRLLGDDLLREQFGRSARQRAIESLSYQAGADILRAAMQDIPVFAGKS